MFVHKTFQSINPKAIAIGIIAIGLLIAATDTPASPFGMLLATAGILCIALRMV